MFRPILHLLTLALCLASTSVWAAAEVRPDHPQTYKVKAGDTLWDIAGRFLRHPWQWPEIWQVNPDIKNPHLIYPGDELEMVYVDGKPRLRKKSVATTKVKLSPKVRADEGAIPPVPREAIAPFLTHPRVLDPVMVENAPHVISFPDGNLIGGEGMRAYAHGMGDSGDAYFDVMRPGRTYEKRATGEVLGYMARHVGTATLVRGGDPATVRLDTTEIEVMRGDRLIPQQRVREPDYFFPRAPVLPMDGQILDAYELISQVGRYQVVLIDLGTADAITSGDVLLVDNRGRTVRDSYGPLEEQRVYDTVGGEIHEAGGTFRQSLIPPEVQLPDERAGTLLVFDAFDRMSLALVMESARPIRKGDRVHSP